MVLAVLEHDRGQLEDTPLQAITFAAGLARQIGTSVEAVLIGQQAEPLAKQLGAYGAEKVHIVSHEQLDDYSPEGWGSALAQLVDSVGPEAVVGIGTDRTHEFMAYMAAKKGQPFSANTVKVEPGDEYKVTRLRWGSSLWEEAKLKGQPKLLSVPLHTVEAEQGEAQEPAVEKFTPELDNKALRTKVARREEEEDTGLTLKNAPVVIGGGRGMGSAENFQILEELAEAMGDAVVGGSRVSTNNGWRPHADQIGLTGTRIAPQIYIPCGISGAIQHLVGCKGAKNILVINKDPEAPFFSKADYGICGDINEIIPAITEEVRKEKQKDS